MNLALGPLITFLGGRPSGLLPHEALLKFLIQLADWQDMNTTAAKGIIAFCLLLPPIVFSSHLSASERARPLEYYIDSLFLPAEEAEFGGWAETCHPDSITLSIDTVGFLMDHLVVELIYNCSHTEWCEEGKAILFESVLHKYQLVYFYTNECIEVYLQPAEIILVDSIEVLFSRCPITGTGGYVEERYWVWNNLASEPANLKLEQVTSEALSQVLPPNYHVAWGGFFDISALSLQCYVRKPGDHNCCPTGGKVALLYGIDGSTLRVVSSSYDPNEIDPVSRSKQR